MVWEGKGIHKDSITAGGECVPASCISLDHRDRPLPKVSATSRTRGYMRFDILLRTEMRPSGVSDR